MEAHSNASMSTLSAMDTLNATSTANDERANASASPETTSRRSPAPDLLERFKERHINNRQSAYTSSTELPPAPIPKLSEEYTLLSLQRSVQLTDPSSERKLLVLDLNGTLLYRTAHKQRTPRSQHQSGGSSQQDPYSIPGHLRALRPVHPRPYVQTLKAYLSHEETRKWLDCMVWSSAMPHSVNDMVGKVFGVGPGVKSEPMTGEVVEAVDGADATGGDSNSTITQDGAVAKPTDWGFLLGVWARDTLGLDTAVYNRKVLTTKDLTKIWTSPLIPLCHSAKTTFLLDDSPHKASFQPWNHLCVGEYTRELWRRDLEIYKMTNPPQQMEPAETSNQEEPPQSKDNVATESPSKTPYITPKERKRKAKKEKKRQESQKAVKGLSEPSPTVGADDHYDSFLLAIIGILEQMKWEENVASWVRSGGLLGPFSDGESSEDAEDGHRDKRHHTIPDENESTPQAELNSAVDEPVTPPHWFTDKQVYDYWVGKGRTAVKQLGIEEVVGDREIVTS